MHLSYSHHTAIHINKERSIYACIYLIATTLRAVRVSTNSHTHTHTHTHTPQPANHATNQYTKHSVKTQNETDRQTERKTDRQTVRQTDRQKDRQTDRRTCVRPDQFYVLVFIFLWILVTFFSECLWLNDCMSSPLLFL